MDDVYLPIRKFHCRVYYISLSKSFVIILSGATSKFRWFGVRKQYIDIKYGRAKNKTSAFLHRKKGDKQTEIVKLDSVFKLKDKLKDSSIAVIKLPKSAIGATEMYRVKNTDIIIEDKTEIYSVPKVILSKVSLSASTEATAIHGPTVKTLFNNGNLLGDDAGFAVAGAKPGAATMTSNGFPLLKAELLSDRTPKVNESYKSETLKGNEANDGTCFENAERNLKFEENATIKDQHGDECTPNPEHGATHSSVMANSNSEETKCLSGDAVVKRGRGRPRGTFKVKRGVNKKHVPHGIQNKENFGKKTVNEKRSNLVNETENKSSEKNASTSPKSGPRTRYFLKRRLSRVEDSAKDAPKKKQQCLENPEETTKAQLDDKSAVLLPTRRSCRLRKVKVYD